MYDKDGNYIGPQTDWGNVASGFGSGLADVIGARGRMEGQQTLADTAKFDIDEFYKDFEAGKYDAKMSSEMEKFFSMTKEGPNLDSSYANLATTLDSASNDPRMAASVIPGLNTSFTKGVQDQENKFHEYEMQGASARGQAYQGLDADNLAFSRGIYGQQLQDNKLAYGTALNNKMQMDEARRQGWGNMAGSVLEGLSSFAEDGMKIPEYQDGGDVMQQILASQEQGGVPPRQDLPGEEDHESNPISMVAPDGEVVGEATGGEIILNGEQTEEIESAVAMVDQAVEAGGEPPMEALMALYEAVSGVLSQPQFQDGQQESSSPEQDNMMAFLEGQQMA